MQKIPKKLLTISLWAGIITHVVRSTTPNDKPAWGISSAGRALAWHARGQRFDPAILHHTVRTRTRFSMRKGSGTFFVYQRFCGRTTRNGKRAKAGYHHGGGILPFALRDQGRFVRTWSSPYMTHWGQSLCTCVPGACTPLTRCNTLDFVPKSVCQGAKPLRIPAERVRTYAEKWQNFTISGCSFMEECGILGLTQ